MSESEDDSLGSLDQDSWGGPSVIQGATIGFETGDCALGDFGSCQPSAHEPIPTSHSTVRRRRQKKRGFACFGGGRRQEVVEESDSEDEMSVSPPSSASLPVPKAAFAFLPDSKINNRVDLALLRQHQPEIYALFHKFLAAQFCDENLECWEALSEIQGLQDKSQILEHLQTALETFFLSTAPRQVGCTEIYRPMAELCFGADGLSIEEIKLRLGGISETLDCASLRDPFLNWARNQHASQL